MAVDWVSGAFALGGAIIGAGSSWALQRWIQRREERSAGRVIFLELAQNQLALAAILASGNPEVGILTTDAWRTQGYRIGFILTSEELVTVAEPYFQLPTLMTLLAADKMAALSGPASIAAATKELAKALLPDLGEAAAQLGRRAFGKRDLDRVRKRLQGP